MDINKIVFKILNKQEYDADHFGAGRYLTKLGGCADNGGPSDYGLGDWQIEFNVKVTNKEGKSKQFLVIFQPEERTHKMTNYAGWEVSTAGRFGCDADQSQELLEFCDYEESVINSLAEVAGTYAKIEWDRLINSTCLKEKN